MRAILLAAFATALVAGTSHAAGGDVLVLDLSNWGEDVYYLHGRSLAIESNGESGPQADADAAREAAADALVLP